MVVGDTLVVAKGFAGFVSEEERGSVRCVEKSTVDGGGSGSSGSGVGWLSE